MNNARSFGREIKWIKKVNLNADSFKFTDVQGKIEPTSTARDEMATAHVPSKRTLSFRELLKTKSDTTPEIALPVQAEPLRVPTSTKPVTKETEADAWEKAELKKIKQKYLTIVIMKILSSCIFFKLHRC